jgi:hypothetical protein
MIFMYFYSYSYNMHGIISSRGAFLFIVLWYVSFKSYSLADKKRLRRSNISEKSNNNIFWYQKYIYLKKVQSIYVVYQRMQPVLEICCYFCNALSNGYQRIYMRCIVC